MSTQVPSIWSRYRDAMRSDEVPALEDLFRDDRILSIRPQEEEEPSFMAPPARMGMAPMGAAGPTSAEPNELPASMANVGQPQPELGPEWEGSSHVMERPDSPSMFKPWVRNAARMIPYMGQTGLAMAGLADFPQSMPEMVPEPPPRGMPDFSDVVSGTSGFFPGNQAAAPVAAAQPPPSSGGRARAIRLPDGRIMLTNDDSYAGEEVSGRSVGAAGQVEEAAVKAGPQRSGSSTYFPPINATNETMRALVRRAAQDPSSNGGVSTFSGTPEQQARLTIEGLMRETALGEATNAARLSNMRPEERAALDIPEIQIGREMSRMFGPSLSKTNSDEAIQLQAISDPQSPRYIEDQKARADAIRMIQQKAEEDRAVALAIMSSMMRQRIPGM